MTSKRSALSAFGAVGAAALGTASLARARAARAEADYPPLGDFVEVEGVRVHHLRRGSGPEVILLHGAGGNLREFAFDLMGRLEADYAVTAFDRPGLGYTDRVPGHTPRGLVAEGPMAQAALLRRAAETLGIRAPVVVGHSFGGIVALAWALTGLDDPRGAAPRAVVGLGGVALPWPGELKLYYTLNGGPAGYLTIPAISAFATRAMVHERIVSTFAPQPVPAGYEEFIGAGLTLRPANLAANLRQVNTLRPHVVEMARRYGELSLPIELVHGALDETVPADVHARPMAARHPGTVHLTELEGVGHMPHHADPEAVRAAIARALARSEDRT